MAPTPLGIESKRSPIKIDGTRKAGHTLDDVSSHCEHRNTTMLELYSTTAVEGLNISIFSETYTTRQEMTRSSHNLRA